MDQVGKNIIVVFLIFYLLSCFTGCISENSEKFNQNETINSVTLIQSIQMFDFSKGKYITEHGDNEDIDVLFVTDAGTARLYAYNGAEIKKQQDTIYTTFVDVSVGTTCILIDNGGGTATFNITKIGHTLEGIPTVSFTYTYTR